MRFTDKSVPAASRDEEFRNRKRVPSVVHFAVLFGANFILVLLAYVFSKTMIGFAVAVFILLAIMNAVTVWSLQRTRDLLMVTEFQNAIFGGAISLGTTFCLIVRRDGAVEYADRGWRTLFPQYARHARRMLEECLTTANVSKEDADKIYAALPGEAASQHIVTLRDADGIAHKVMLAIDPLRRPQEFVMLRGRPYVERA